jgi:hypothetical protein
VYQIRSYLHQKIEAETPMKSLSKSMASSIIYGVLLTRRACSMTVASALGMVKLLMCFFRQSEMELLQNGFSGVCYVHMEVSLGRS